MSTVSKKMLRVLIHLWRKSRPNGPRFTLERCINNLLTDDLIIDTFYLNMFQENPMHKYRIISTFDYTFPEDDIDTVGKIQ